ncbi:hypothetical protein CcaCcLH18_00796 [Colletotrichum camelliae]|nr:hypothetical protein CcaCcLH18_00796 [Colletotrichum camelliae]
MATSDDPSRSFDNGGQTTDDTFTSKSPEMFDNESASRLVGEEVDQTMTPKAETPLHVFLRDLGKDIHDPEDRLKILAILEKSPRDIDTRSLERPCRTPLQIAIENNYFRIFRLLLQEGADVNVLDEDNTHSLLLAVLWKNSKFLGPLLDHGALSKDPKPDGMYLLHESGCYMQDETTMLRLLERHRHLLDSQVLSLFTPLNLAVYRGYKTMVDVLLKQGADLGIANVDGWTPLMTAVKTSHFEIFDCLVGHLFEPGREDIMKDVISRNDNEEQSVFMAFCESDSNGEAIESSLDRFLAKILGKFPHLDFSKTFDDEGLLDLARSLTKRFKSKTVNDFGMAVFERVPNETLL